MLYDRTTETSGLQSSSSTKSYIEINCDELFDLIEGMQSRRLEEQRAPMPSVRENLPAIPSHKDENSRDGYSANNQITSALNNNNEHSLPGLNEINENVVDNSEQMPLGVNICLNDEFFDLLIKCQSSRLEDQRSSLPSSLFTFPEPSENSDTVDPNVNISLHTNDIQNEISIDHELSSAEAEDFYIFLMGIQSATRIEDQRTTFPIVKNYTKISSAEK